MTDDGPHPPTGGWDHAAAYRELRARVTELVRERADAELDQPAPATPAWRVRDLVAHLAGVCDDVANGRLEGVATDAWTDAQVAKRRDWPTDRVLADWQEHATAIEPRFSAFPPVAAGQMLFDACTHEHDVRGALRAPGGRDSTALAIAFDWGTDRLGERLVSEQAGTLRLDTEVGARRVGDGRPETRLRADRFEVVRAMTGRRSRAQLGAMEWHGPFDPEGLLLAPIFSPAAHDLTE